MPEYLLSQAEKYSLACLGIRNRLVIHKTSVGDVNVLEHGVSNPKIVLLCIHGLCSDARIFNYLGLQLSKHGIHVISIDVFGHGKSSGEKGDPDFDQSLQAIHEIIQEYKEKSKIFILAHSMGCTYALWYVHKFPDSVSGLVLMAPYIRVKTIKKRSNVEPNIRLFLKLFLRCIFTPQGKANVAQVLPGFVKYGGDEILQMLNDKELNSNYSYRYIIDVLAKRNDDISVLSSPVLPVLIIHGKNDKNIFPTVSEEFIKTIKTEDKALFLPDSDHWFYDAIFYNQDSKKFAEEDRQKIVKKIESWISAHY